LMMIELPRNPIGHSSTRVSALGLGCAFLGQLLEPGSDREDGDAEAAEVVSGLPGSGVNYVDAARLYQKGDCERRLGRALRGLSAAERAESVISTKAGREPDGVKDFDGGFVQRSVDRSLRLLGLEYIVILYLHDPSCDNHMENIFASGGALEALEALKSEGVIGAIGLGVQNHRFQQTAIDSGRFDVVLLPYDFNPVRNSSAGLIDAAAAKGIGVIIASPYASGLLAGIDPREAVERRKVEPADAARAISIWSWCRERELDTGVLSMQYCLRKAGVASILVGPRTVGEWDANRRHATTEVPGEVMEEFLSFLESLPPGAPGGERG